MIALVTYANERSGTDRHSPVGNVDFSGSNDPGSQALSSQPSAKTSSSLRKLALEKL
jgi:hypothetical protein